MLKYLSGVASQAASTAATSLRDRAVETLHKNGVPDKLSRGATMLGISDCR